MHTEAHIHTQKKSVKQFRGVICMLDWTKYEVLIKMMRVQSHDSATIPRFKNDTVTFNTADRGVR